MRQLVNGDPEFGIDMPCRYFCIPSGQDMRSDTDAHRNGISINMAKLFKNGYVVDIDPYPEACTFLDFLNGNAVGGENNIPWIKTGFKSQLYFLNGNCI